MPKCWQWWDMIRKNQDKINNCTPIFNLTVLFGRWGVKVCILESVCVSDLALSSELLLEQILGLAPFSSASVEFMWCDKKNNKKTGNNRWDVQIWKPSTQRGNILVHYAALCSSAAFWSAVATNCHVVALPRGHMEAAVTGSGTVTQRWQFNSELSTVKLLHDAHTRVRSEACVTNTHTEVGKELRWDGGFYRYFPLLKLGK